MLPQDPDIFLKGAKMMTYFSLSFVLGIWLAPILISILNKAKFWKKVSRTQDVNGKEFEHTKKFYEEEKKTLTPRAGGILIWGTTLIIAVVFFLALKLIKPATGSDLGEFLNFIDSRQTFIPMGVLILGALLGLVDDYLAVSPKGGNYFAGGLKLSQRMVGVVFISFLVGLWFHLKIGDVMHKITLPWPSGNPEAPWAVLNLNNIHLPFGWLDGLVETIFGINPNLSSGGWLIIPLTIAVMTFMWGSSVIDGFDGITAGSLIPVYLAFAGLAFVGEYYQIATFLMVVTGAMVAYLWYNIPPARFYMGDTGSTPLLLVLATVALFIDKLFALPVIAAVFIMTVMSNILQVFWKKVFKKKLFLAAPIHHHFEAGGWLRHQVTMRFWLISIVASVLGFAIGILVTNRIY